MESRKISVFLYFSLTRAVQLPLLAKPAHYYNTRFMKKANLQRLKEENLFDLIGKEWMLVTAGTPEKFNTMTASWGGLGFLWNKPVAFIFIRPERYTYDFIEREERLTLSFLGKEHQDIHQICGKKSGRDCDKVKESGLCPVTTEAGNVTFSQARLTLEGRKLFVSDMKPEMFLDSSLLKRWYSDQPGGSFHRIYIIEIENIYER